MRLINVYTLKLTDFPGDHQPPYAILSHRWTYDESSFKDFFKRKNPTSTGYRKVKAFCKFVAEDCPRQCEEHGYSRSDYEVEWVWIDTVCIDKRSSAELSEAINSMWRWYAYANYCVAFLADVSIDLDRGPFKKDSHQIQLESSDWFNRGWTLQELLAPHEMVFCDRKWNIFGVKRSGMARAPERVTLFQMENHNLLNAISHVTGIPTKYIENPSDAQRACFAKKLSWASSRVTSREEDMAYCLLGLLNINLPLLYGEGGFKAFQRLQQEFIRQSDDESIFAWFDSFNSSSGILAPRAYSFRYSKDIEIIRSMDAEYIPRQPYAVTNKGLLIESLAYKLWEGTNKDFHAMQRRQIAETKGLNEMNRAPQEWRFSRPPTSSRPDESQLYLIPLNCRDPTVKFPVRSGAEDDNDGFFIGRQGHLVHSSYSRKNPQEGSVYEAHMGQKCMIVLRENEGGISSRILKPVNDSRVRYGPYVSNGEAMAEKKFLITLTGLEST